MWPGNHLGIGLMERTCILQTNQTSVKYNVHVATSVSKTDNILS